MNRRLPAILCTVCLLLFAVSFGGRLKLSSNSPDSLRFTHTFTTESERGIIDAAIAEFKQHHPDITIQQTILNSEVYQTVGWRLQLRGRHPPDIFFLWDGYKTDYAIEEDWALNLGRYLTQQFSNQFVSGTVRADDGSVWFLPHSVDICNLVWYNRDLFSAQDLSVPDTFEDWLELVEKIRSLNLLPIAQGNRDLWPMGNFGAELVGQAIGPARVDDLFLPGVEPDGADVVGLHGLDALRREGAFDFPGVLEPGGIGTLGDIDAKVMFLSGKSAMHIVGSWFIADIEDARARGELNFEIGVFPVPPNQGQPDVMAAVTTGYMVSRNTANPKACAQFLELLLSPKYQAEFARLGGLSARVDADAFTTNPTTKTLHRFLAETPLKVPPSDTAYRPEQAQLFYQICADLLTGKLKMEDVTDRWREGKISLAGRGL